MWLLGKTKLLLSSIIFIFGGAVFASSLLIYDGEELAISDCAEFLVKNHTNFNGEVDLKKLATAEHEHRAVLKLMKDAGIEPSAELTKHILKAAFDSSDSRTKFELLRNIQRENTTMAEVIEQKSLDYEEQFKAASMFWVEKEFSSNVEVSSEELYKFYQSSPQLFLVPEQREVGYIATKNQPDSANKMRRVEALLMQGEQFDKLFDQYNTLTSAELRVLATHAKVVDMANSLTPDNLIGSVTLPDTIAVVKLVAYAPERTLSFSEAKPTLERNITEQKIRILVNKSISDEMKKHTMIIKDGDEEL